ncbi:MAG: sodium:proton antiporter [Pseudomonadota bacterium]
MDNLVLAAALIGVLGIGAQWFAWRFNLPAIVLMAIAGVAAGPVLGVFSSPDAAPGAPPMEALFGEFYRPLIAIAVAVILFEGGLQLKFDELRGVSKAVRRLVFPGALISWGAGAAAAHYIAGLSWQVSLLFAGVMVVTGPTVIIPLLRQSSLNQRPATLLKWEGIVNDPIGALLAVLIFEFIVAGGHDRSAGDVAASIILAAILSGFVGYLVGRGVAATFRRGLVPEYLKPPVLLALVLLTYELANQLEHEAGLVAVTVMGATLANARLASIHELQLFKENITVVLVSGVFIILTANLTFQSLALLDWSSFWFITAMLLLVRPISIFVSTIGAGLPLRERLFVGWIAPRGVVAVAVSSFFGVALVEEGYAEGAMLIPLAFAMVFTTVIAHGFSIAPLAKSLGLASRERPGVLIVGASPWSVQLAETVRDLEVPVLVADASFRRLRPARLADIPTYYGEILSEVTEHHLDLRRFGYVLAVSGNEAHNALVATDLGPELGRAAIFQVNARSKEETERQIVSYTLRGRTLFQNGTPLDELLKRHYGGWVYQRTKLSDAYPPERYFEDLPADAELVFAKRKDALVFSSRERPLKPEIGDTVVAYCPRQHPQDAARQSERDGDAQSQPDAAPTVNQSDQTPASA